MAEYKILLTKKASKQLDKLPDSIAKPIIVSIEKLANDPRPSNCKKLKGKNAYRIRKGNYRVIYEIIDNELIITVILVGHRKDIYK